jgi:hypothetical protein
MLEQLGILVSASDRDEHFTRVYAFVGTPRRSCGPMKILIGARYTFPRRTFLVWTEGTNNISRVPI